MTKLYDVKTNEDLYDFLEEFTSFGYNQSYNKYHELFLDLVEDNFELINSKQLSAMCKVQADICEQDAIFEQIFEEQFPNYYQQLKKKIIKALFSATEPDPLYWVFIYEDILKINESSKLQAIYDSLSKKEIVTKDNLYYFSVKVPSLTRVLAADNEYLRRDLVIVGSETIVDKLNLDSSYLEPWLELPESYQHRYLVRYVLARVDLSHIKIRQIRAKYRLMKRVDLLRETENYSY